jgi:uncharacterized protein (DUF433 family)
MITDIGSLITQSPDIREGRARIAGKGVTVARIVVWYQLGLSPEEIAERIAHVTIAEIYAALAYYHLNRSEIDDDLAQETAFAEQLEEERSTSGPSE